MESDVREETAGEDLGVGLLAGSGGGVAAAVGGGQRRTGCPGGTSVAFSNC